MGNGIDHADYGSADGIVERGRVPCDVRGPPVNISLTQKRRACGLSECVESLGAEIASSGRKIRSGDF